MAERVFAISRSTNGVSRLPKAHGSESFALPVREFIAGPENLLLTQARATVTLDWGRFNPLFVHGPSGVGKTHLLHCLVDLARETYPRLQQTLVTGADYARAIAEAIDVDSLGDLRDTHCAGDLFVLDGLHQIATKQVTQLELVQLLDDAVQQGLQVIVTSLHSVDRLPGLRAELVSRLSGGLVVPLAMPRIAARESILRHLSELHGMKLSDDQISAVARVATTATELRSGLQQRSCRGEDAWPVARHSKPTDTAIVKAVAKHFRVTVRELTGASRRQSVVQARAACVYLIRTLLEPSFQRIGLLLGDRDHTTVLHAFRRAEQFLQDDPCFERAVQDVVRIVAEQQGISKFAKR